MELGVSYSLQTRFRRGNCPLPYNTGTATQQNLFTAWARILRQAKRPEMGVRAKAAPRKACTWLSPPRPELSICRNLR